MSKKAKKTKKKTPNKDKKQEHITIAILDKKNKQKKNTTRTDLVEEAGLGLLAAGGSGAGEVSIVELLVQGNGREVDLGGRSRDVGLVHAAQRDAVDLVGASDQKETRLQLLQEHNALHREERERDGYG